jgi:hypothetical protein
MSEQVTIDKQTLETLRDAANEHHSNLEYWIDNYGMDEIEWVTACCITSETTFEELKDYNEKLGSALTKEVRGTMMERSEKELRPYAEYLLKILEYWSWDVGVSGTLDIRCHFKTQEKLDSYIKTLKKQLDENRLDVMKDRVGALEFGEEVFRDGLVDTENGVYLASVMREARIRLEAEINEWTRV